MYELGDFTRVSTEDWCTVSSLKILLLLQESVCQNSQLSKIHSSSSIFLHFYLEPTVFGGVGLYGSSNGRVAVLVVDGAVKGCRLPTEYLCLQVRRSLVLFRRHDEYEVSGDN